MRSMHVYVKNVMSGYVTLPTIKFEQISPTRIKSPEHWIHMISLLLSVHEHGQIVRTISNSRTGTGSSGG